jgi:hypothetical protein
MLDVEYNEGALKSPSLVKLCSYFVLITLLPETSYTISSTLLNGTNWLQWSEVMDAYIMSEGHRQAITAKCPNIPSPVTDSDGNVENQSDINKATEKCKDWDLNNERMMGYVRLRVSSNVA